MSVSVPLPQTNIDVTNECVERKVAQPTDNIKSAKYDRGEIDSGLVIWAFQERTFFGTVFFFAGVVGDGGWSAITILELLIEGDDLLGSVDTDAALGVL